MHFCATGYLPGVKRLTMNGIDCDIGDYDGRTALHLAASEGHLEILQFLISSNHVKNINPIDRWGNTPLDDAYRSIF